MSTHYPSLLLSTNSHHARWFVVEEDKILPIDERREAKTDYTDHEGYFETSGGGKTIHTGTHEIEDAAFDQETKEHVRESVKKTSALYTPKQYKHLMVTAPDQVKTLLIEELRRQMPQISYRFVTGNYVREPNDRLLAVAKESLKVFYK